MIEVAGLKKSFGEVTALRNVSFTASDAKVTGLLGHNGAGKTTTIKMITGQIEPIIQQCIALDEQEH